MSLQHLYGLIALGLLQIPSVVDAASTHQSVLNGESVVASLIEPWHQLVLEEKTDGVVLVPFTDRGLDRGREEGLLPCPIRLTSTGPDPVTITLE